MIILLLVLVHVGIWMLYFSFSQNSAASQLEAEERQLEEKVDRRVREHLRAVSS